MEYHNKLQGVNGSQRRMSVYRLNYVQYRVLIKGENNRTINGQYRLTQKDRSMFWEVTVSVTVGKILHMDGHVSNCEGLPRYSCLKLQT